MAVVGLGLAFQAGSSAAAGGLVIPSAQAPSDIVVVWQTSSVYPSEWCASFTVAVNWRYVLRGGDGWSDWKNDNEDASDGWWFATVPAAQCSPMALGVGTSWALSLSQLNGFLAHIGNLAFASRSYDAVGLTIKCKANYADGTLDATGSPSSPVSYADASILWQPSGAVESISYGVETVVVKYDMSGWARTDDAFTLRVLSVLGAGSLIGAPVELMRTAPGTLELPLSALLKVPGGGDATAAIDVRPSYCATSLATIFGGTPFVNASVCNDPGLECVANSDGSLSVTLSDEGGQVPDVPIVAATVSIDGGTLDCDSQTISPGETAVFWPPLDVPLSVSCFAWGDDSTNQASAEVDAIPSKAAISISTQDGRSARFAYNVSASRSLSRECEELKLAGRDRSTVFFGEGATVTRSIGATVFEGSGEHAFVLSLDGARDVIVRLPDGDRFLGAVTAVSVDRGLSTDDVSLTMTEVADGRLV